MTNESGAGQLGMDFCYFVRDVLEPRRVDVALRALDIVVASVLICLLFPLIMLVSALIWITSGRPVFYRGERIGRFGRSYVMFKFRTLRPDAESRLGTHYGEELTHRSESEVTPLGRLLRASQLDELPQLWNVLIGDMSIVGPRPLRLIFHKEVMRAVPQYWQRHAVRPGLTGLAQLRLTREDPWEDKLLHDLEYIADRSILLWLRVVAITALRIARQTVAALVGCRLSRMVNSRSSTLSSQR